MSIQSNINQGISLVSLLVSQSPQATKARVAADVAARKPERDAEVALSANKAKVATEEREKTKLLFEEEERKRNVERTKATYESHYKLVEPIEKTLTGEIHSGSAQRKKWAEHLTTRDAAIKSGKALFELEPTTELRTQLGELETDYEALSIHSKTYNSAEAQAERKARNAAAKERRRLKESKKITDAISGGDV